jgi:hypothetical protein
MTAAHPGARRSTSPARLVHAGRDGPRLGRTDRGVGDLEFFRSQIRWAWDWLETTVSDITDPDGEVVAARYGELDRRDLPPRGHRS